jgi:TP901 family phage tail tape measure protein
MASPITVDIEGRYSDREIQRALTDIKKLQAASIGMGQRMQNVGDQVQAVGRSVSKFGKSMTVGVTLPIVGVGVAATKMAMDFDESMTKIVSLVGLSRDQVQEMRADVLRLAGETAKAPQELAEALFVVTSAGLRGADAISALEMSAKAGAAGLGETKDIARAVAGALNAYGTETLSAARATDIIVATARAGNFETSQFAASLGNVLPFAKQAQGSMEDVGGAVALLTRTNGDAAKSITQVSSLFGSFVAPSRQAEKILASIGMTAGDVRDSIGQKGLVTTLKDLDKALGGNREELGKVLGRKEAMSAAFQILDADAATVADTFGVVTDSVNMTGDAFGVTGETASFKMQAAFTGIKTSLIELGEVIAPIVGTFADRIKTLTDSFVALSPQTKVFIVQGLAIAAAIGPVLLIVGKLITVIGGVIKVIGVLVAAFNPVTLVIAAVVGVIALVVAAFKLAYDRSEPLRKAVQDLVTTLRNLFNVVRNSVLGAFTSMNKTLGESNGFFSKLGQYLGVAFTRIVQTLTNIVKVLGAAFQVAVKVFEVGFTIMRMGASIIRGVLIAAFDILMNKLGPISAALRGIANGVRSAFTMVAGIVSSAFSNVGKAVETFINFGIKAVNALIDAYNKLVGFLPGVTRATRIAEFRFQSLSAATNESTTATYNALSATGANIRETERAAQPVADLADGMGDLAAGMGDVGKAGGSAAKGAKDAGDESEKAGKKLEKFKSKFAEVADALKKAREDIERDYTAMVTSVTNAIMGALDFNAALPEVDENGERVGKTFIEKLQEQAELATGFAARIRTLIAEGLSLEAIQMVVAAGVTAGTKIADELIDGGATAIDETNRLIESTQLAANAIGVDAAGHFFGAGLALAKQTEDAFTKRFGEGGPGYNKLNRLMNHLAKSMERTTTITVNTVHTSTGSPGGGRIIAGAAGGIVNRPTFALIGEAGPEAVIPLGRSRGNDPLPMTGRSGSLSMGTNTTINLTVNAGMGTQGAEVGRQIVDALKAYERRNGAVYVAA